MIHGIVMDTVLQLDGVIPGRNQWGDVKGGLEMDHDVNEISQHPGRSCTSPLQAMAINVNAPSSL